MASDENLRGSEPLSHLRTSMDGHIKREPSRWFHLGGRRLIGKAADLHSQTDKTDRRPFRAEARLVALQLRYWPN
jgi:hypothetical protein